MNTSLFDGTIDPDLLSLGDVMDQISESDLEGAVEDLLGEIEADMDVLGDAEGLADVIEDITGDPIMAMDLEGNVAPIIKNAVSRAVRTVAKKHSRAKAAAAVRRVVKHRMLAGKALFPYLCDSVAIKNLKSNARLASSKVQMTFNRFIAFAPGISRFQSFPGGGTITATFGAPSAGQSELAPAVELRFIYQRLNEYNSFTFALSLSGKAEDPNRTLSITKDLFQVNGNLKGNQVPKLIVIPTSEVSTELNPQLVRANSANPLTITLEGVPAGITVEIFLLGSNDVAFRRLASLFTSQKFTTPGTTGPLLA
jgi:hypothetical protein